MSAVRAINKNARAVAMTLGVMLLLLAAAGGNAHPPSEPDAFATVSVGLPAPPLALADLDGVVVTLDRMKGAPTVVIFGSYTSPQFRAHAKQIAELRARFEGRGVNWLLVYTREAHPSDAEPVMPVNAKAGIDVPQPRSFQERLRQAALAVDRLGLGSLTVLVDDMKNSAARAYRGVPHRGVVLDHTLSVVSDQVWFEVDRTGRILDRLLEEEHRHPQAPNPEVHTHPHPPGPAGRSNADPSGRRVGHQALPGPIGAAPTAHATAHGKDSGPCVCDLAQQHNGWCPHCQVGYIGLVKINSADLFNAIDAHGHTIDPTSIDCSSCQAAIITDGFCASCGVGFVEQQLYASRLSHALAVGSSLDGQLFPCPAGVDHAPAGQWCGTCQRGVVGNAVFSDAAGHQRAAVELERLQKAADSPCSTCAVVMMTRGVCRVCDISYRGPSGP